jgi:hypothetical protein
MFFYVSVFLHICMHPWHVQGLYWLICVITFMCNIRICVPRNYSIMKILNQIYSLVINHIFIISYSFILYIQLKGYITRDNYLSSIIIEYLLFERIPGCNVSSEIFSFDSSEWILFHKYIFFWSNTDHGNDRISFRRIMDLGNRNLPSFVAHSNTEY